MCTCSFASVTITPKFMKELANEFIQKMKECSDVFQCSPVPYVHQPLDLSKEYFELGQVAWIVRDFNDAGYCHGSRVNGPLIKHPKEVITPSRHQVAEIVQVLGNHRHPDVNAAIRIYKLCCVGQYCPAPVSVLRRLSPLAKLKNAVVKSAPSDQASVEVVCCSAPQLDLEYAVVKYATGPFLVSLNYGRITVSVTFEPALFDRLVMASLLILAMVM
jgi:hypothetical protein